MVVIFIYALVDPRNNSVFYVGSTNNTKIRIAKHKYEARHKRFPNPKDSFIRDMLIDGYFPKMQILEQTSEDIAFARELFWIRHFEAKGAVLLNQQDLSRRVHMRQVRGGNK